MVGLLYRSILTFFVAVCGVSIFYFFKLPVPFLLGPIAGCLIAAVSGLPLQGTGQFGTLMRTILGVAVGASITPELLNRLPGMAYSVALVIPFVVCIGMIGYPFFRRVCHLDPVTAYYSAMPGGFPEMVLFGGDSGGNMRALSLVHATRVLVIVSFIPFMFSSIYHLSLTNLPGIPAAQIPVTELLLMAAAAIVGWKGAERIKLFGASLLGPLVLTAILSLSGFIKHRLPAEAIVAAQFFIGIAIGAKYTGVTWSECRRYIFAGFLFCLFLASISILFAEGVTLAGFASPVEAFLAFAPGGQSEMVVLSILAGADVAFIVTHHLARLIIVITCAPIISRLMRLKSDRE